MATEVTEAACEATLSRSCSGAVHALRSGSSEFIAHVHRTSGGRVHRTCGGGGCPDAAPLELGGIGTWSRNMRPSSTPGGMITLLGLGLGLGLGSRLGLG